MKVTAKIYISSIIEIGGEKSLIFLISHDDNSLLFFKWKPPFTLQCTIDSHFFIHLNNNNPSFLAATIHISLIIIIISSTSSCEWAAINNNNSRDWDSITIFYISIAPPARFSNEHEMDCVCVCHVVHNAKVKMTFKTSEFLSLFWFIIHRHRLRHENVCFMLL